MYKVDDLANLLNATNKSIITWKKELINHCLIMERRMGNCKCNRIYVLKINPYTSMQEDIENVKESYKILTDKPIKFDFVNKEEEKSTQEENQVLTEENKKEENDENDLKDKKVASRDLENIEKVKDFKFSKDKIDDEIEKYTEYEKIIKDNIFYDEIKQSIDKMLLNDINNIIELMVECICTKERFVNIGNKQYLKEIVKKKFLNLRYEHIKSVIDSHRKINYRINNPKSYILTCLYNVKNTYDFDLDNLIKADLEEF